MGSLPIAVNFKDIEGLPSKANFKDIENLLSAFLSSGMATGRGAPPPVLFKPTIRAAVQH
jgi:hypothetical protein